MPTPTGVQEPNTPLASTPFVALTTTVPNDAAMAPSAAEGWTTVEPMRKSVKHIRANPKGKEVIEVAVVPNMTPSTGLPVYTAVIDSLGAATLVGAAVDSGSNICLAPPSLGEDSPNVVPMMDLVLGCMNHRNSSKNTSSRKASTPFSVGDG